MCKNSHILHMGPRHTLINASHSLILLSPSFFVFPTIMELVYEAPPPITRSVGSAYTPSIEKKERLRREEEKRAVEWDKYYQDCVRAAESHRSAVVKMFVLRQKISGATPQHVLFDCMRVGWSDGKLCHLIEFFASSIGPLTREHLKERCEEYGCYPQCVKLLAKLIA